MKGLQTTKSLQIMKMDHYILCIMCTLNHSRSIPGLFTLAYSYFWDIRLPNTTLTSRDTAGGPSTH